MPRVVSNYSAFRKRNPFRTVNVRGRWIADGHHHDGKRFVVRANEKLTAFLELESVIRPDDAVPQATEWEQIGN
jgi:hypothetical protein